MHDATALQPRQPRQSSPREVAISFFNQGVTQAKQGDQRLSYQMLGSAVQVDPTFALGWFQVGNANADMKLLPASVACFRRALELDGTRKQIGDIDPQLRAQLYINIGHRLYHMGRIPEAREWTMKALETGINPAFAWCNLSLIQSVEGELDASLESALKAFALNKDPQIEMAVAFAYLYSGDFAKGLKHFEARFGYKLHSFVNFPYSRWKGHKLDKTKTLYVHAEQGLGDTLCFLRFIPAVAERVGKVILNIQPELLQVAHMALGHVPNVVIGPIPAPLPHADFWIPMTSLPIALGLSSDEIRNYPNLSIGWGGLPVTRAQWKSTDRKLHVGVAWGGSRHNDIDVHRSFDVRNFLELYRVPGIQLYSLQKGERVEELHAHGCATLIRDLNPFINSAYDTMEIIRQLDLVITVESSPLHMANFVGCEAWTPYSYAGRDWRCGHDGSGGVVWGPKVRLFKQKADMSWDHPFEQITEALRERVKP